MKEMNQSPVVFQWLSHATSFLLTPCPRPQEMGFYAFILQRSQGIPRRAQNSKPLAFPSQHFLVAF